MGSPAARATVDLTSLSAELEAVLELDRTFKTREAARKLRALETRARVALEQLELTGVPRPPSKSPEPTRQPTRSSDTAGEAELSAPSGIPVQDIPVVDAEAGADPLSGIVPVTQVGAGEAVGVTEEGGRGTEDAPGDTPPEAVATPQDTLRNFLHSLQEDEAVS